MLFPWQLVRATGSGQLWLAGGAGPINYKPLPIMVRAMTEAWDFVATLISPTKSGWAIKSSVESAYGDKGMSYS